MRRLRHFLDRVEPLFLKGGRYEQFGALLKLWILFSIRQKMSLIIHCIFVMQLTLNGS